MLYKRSSKHGAHWWVRFTVKGVEIRRSSGTDRKERAEAFERQVREALWNAQTLGIEARTWDEACSRWYREKAHKRSLARDRQAVARLDIPGDTVLDDVSDLVHRTDAPSKCGARELATLRSILNACEQWGWIDRAPKVGMPPGARHDPRWITPEQFDALIQELPPHARQLARFGAATGLRSANIRKLKWSDVRGGTAYVASLSAKAGKPLGIPLSVEALAILKQQAKAHPVYVFTDHVGRAPIGSIKTCWIKATTRAGISGFRFHDLRHTWAAWHTLKGTPPLILKELGGWSSLAMVEKYGHINPGHLADWANNSRVKAKKQRTKSGTRKKTPLLTL